MSIARNIRRGAQARKSSIAVATQAVAPTPGKRQLRLDRIKRRMFSVARLITGCLIRAVGGEAATVLVNKGKRK